MVASLVCLSGLLVDGLLTATAKVHRMTLVTRNTTDIGNLSVPILNPFELS